MAWMHEKLFIIKLVWTFDVIMADHQQRVNVGFS